MVAAAALLPDELSALLAQGRGREATARFSDGVSARIATAFKGAADLGIAVWAIGGLARRELTPAADVDIWVLPPEDASDAVQKAIEDALRELWDDGLQLGHAVRSPSESIEAVRTDPTAATALLEARVVAGAREVGTDRLRVMHHDVLPTLRSELMDAKVDELLIRRERFGAAVHLVEPNVKSSPGGLRDIHSLIWIGLLDSPWRADALGSRRNALEHLLGTGRLAEREATVLGGALDLLLATRVALQQVARRREERLLNEHQAAVAEMLAIDPTEDESAAEALLRRYLGVARQVRTTVDGALDRLLEGPARDRWKRARQRKPRRGSPQPWQIEKGFRAQRGRLYADDPSIFDAEPGCIVDLFRLEAERDLIISPRTLARARRASETQDLTENQDVGEALLRLCRSTSVGGRPFTRMLEEGIVGQLLSDLGRLQARFKHDGYHAYTTDAHICRCVDMALRAASGTEPLPGPMQRSYRRTSRYHLFVLGALMHDIGKGLKEDHSVAGGRIVRREADRFGLPPGEAKLLVFLVEQHLLLSRMSQRRDLSDPAVIEELALKVRTVERLDLLALLTWVDIASVAPGMFSDWKAQLLGHAVTRTASWLRDPAAAPVRQLEDDDARAAAHDRLHGVEDAETIDRFLGGASPRSIGARLRRSLERDLNVFATWERLAAEGDETPVVVAVQETESRRAHTVRVCCRQRRRLLPELAAGLAAQGANVLHAHVDFRDDGLALCAFRIDDRGKAMDAATLTHVEHAIREAAEGTEVPPLPQSRHWRGPPIKAGVRLVEGVDSWGAAVVEVQGADWPGLLACLLDAIANADLNVCLAKINTEGSRVRDTFFLLDDDGEAPDDEARQAVGKALERVVAESIA